jgi:deoxyguanosine kinase
MPTYVAVEGLIGSGKSTLASALANLTGGFLYREPVAENPFLARFYAGEPDAALPMQLQFLLARYSQQLEIEERRTGNQALISDYAFEKELVFAPVLLTSAADRDIHSRTYSALACRVRRPDAVVFLRVSVEQCLAGISERNRPIERTIDRDYLSALAAFYETWLSRYSGRAIIIDRLRLRPEGDEADRLARDVLGRLA